MLANIETWCSNITSDVARLRIEVAEGRNHVSSRIDSKADSVIEVLSSVIDSNHEHVLQEFKEGSAQSKRTPVVEQPASYHTPTNDTAYLRRFGEDMDDAEEDLRHVDDPPDFPCRYEM